MKIDAVLSRLLNATVKQRIAGSGPAYALARRIVAAYENNDAVIDTNGEAWLIRQLFGGRRIVAFDVGANCGDWAGAALRAGQDCRVYCYEAVPNTFATLRENISDPRAVLINKALSSKPGTLRICSVLDDPHVSSVVDVREYGADYPIEEIDIEASTGDLEMEALGIDHIDMLKIDVEGHDLDVLFGFEGALAGGRIDVIQFEYNFYTHLAKRALHDFYQLLEPNYLVCRLLPNGLEACRFHFDLETYRQTNWVAVRRAAVDDEMVRRLRIRPARGQTARELGYPAG